MQTDTHDLPLFAWNPPKTTLIAFPMGRRVGRIREVASKTLQKSTARHREFYRTQVNEALERQLKKIGLCEADIASDLDTFWQKVDDEIVRLTYCGMNNPPSAA